MASGVRRNQRGIPSGCSEAAKALPVSAQPLSATAGEETMAFPFSTISKSHTSPFPWQCLSWIRGCQGHPDNVFLGFSVSGPTWRCKNDTLSGWVASGTVSQP